MIKILIFSQDKLNKLKLNYYMLEEREHRLLWLRHGYVWNFYIPIIHFNGHYIQIFDEENIEISIEKNILGNIYLTTDKHTHYFWQKRIKKILRNEWIEAILTCLGVVIHKLNFFPSYDQNIWKWNFFICVRNKFFEEYTKSEINYFIDKIIFKT